MLNVAVLHSYVLSKQQISFLDYKLLLDYNINMKYIDGPMAKGDKRQFWLK